MVPDELIIKPRTSILDVSIRFEVRGGFRPINMADKETRNAFQSALGFAVVSDQRLPENEPSPGRVSIRFKVRGGFRPYPLARRPDKPCCGGFTHHPSSPLPTRGQNLSSKG